MCLLPTASQWDVGIWKWYVNNIEALTPSGCCRPRQVPVGRKDKYLYTCILAGYACALFELVPCQT